jgi:amino acid adenylation domain-containing protein
MTSERPRPVKESGVNRPGEGVVTAPLSYPQLGLYLAEQVVPHGSALTLTSTYDHPGRLDPGLLRSVLHDLAGRQGALRTTLADGEREPRQAVHAAAAPDIEVLDQDDRGAVRSFLHAGFDLYGGPLARVALLRSAADGDRAVLAAHHLVFDDAAKDLWPRELEAVLVRGCPPERPAVQYADFAAWQRQRYTDPARAELWDFWATRLANVPPTVLPARPGRADAARFGRLPLRIDARQAAVLHAAARSAGATPFAAAVAAVAALMADHLGREQVTLGTIVSGRSLAETQPLIGCFTDIGLLPLDTSSGTDLAALTRRARAAVEDLLGREAPFNRLVEVLRPASQPGHLPFTDVGVQLGHAPGTPGGAAAPDEVLGLDRTPFGLEFSFTAFSDGGLAGEVTYRADLYDEWYVSTLADAWPAAVSRGGFRPPRTAGSAQPTAAPGPALRPAGGGARDVLEVIRGQAERTPAAQAVRSGEQSLTYAELDAAAGQVAQALAGTGDRGEVRIGLLAEHGIDLLPALLGILRSGATYVPLDPALPESRLTAMVHDAGIRQALVARPGPVPPLPGVDYIRTADLLGPARPAQAAGEPAIPPGRAAYIMFTSGSTGRPKGVVIEHSALLATLGALQDEIGLHPGDRMLALTPTSFDISLVELLLPLMNGATVVHAPPGLARFGDELVTLINSAGITHVQATPAGWRMIIDSDPGRTVQVTALCGGDTLAPDLAGELRRRAPRGWNLYGPTEATIWASAQRIDQLPPGPVPIGSPLANARLHVLDGGGSPRPVGAAGELWIAGTGLARGYLDPQQTAAAFREHDRFGRLYRTGDQARERPDGALEFLGRLDAQVKVSGYRVEVTEIETALRRLPQISDGVVLAEAADGGTTRLVARLVLARPADARPDPGQLASELALILPSYMIPATFLVIDKLPVTPHGKVDRMAAARLPAVALGGRAAADPADEIEELVLRVVRDILGSDEISLADNFFQVGGYSLLVLRLVNQIQQECGVRLPIRTVFTAPSVQQLAGTVRAGWEAQAGPDGLVAMAEVPGAAP